MKKKVLRELFDYKDGHLFWKKQQTSRALKGSKVGCIGTQGYRQTRYKGKNYRVHRLIWEYFNDRLPLGLEIDHINGVRDDNRIANLRPTTCQENHFNRTVAKGYTYRSKTGNWEASIKRDGKTIYLGRYKTEKEARMAYLGAKKKYHKLEEKWN